jgi:hypothetical protein
MNRTAGVVVLLATLAGCVNDNPGPYMGSYWGNGSSSGNTCGCRVPPSVPNVQGPWGQPVAMAAPYTSSPPQGAEAARAMLESSLPLNQVQRASYTPTGDNASAIVPAGGPVPGAMPPPGGLSPPGVPAMPGMAPPTAGVPLPMGGPRAPGAVAAIGALTGPGPQPFPAQRTEIFFTGPPTMKVSWYAPTPGGGAGFTADYVEAPGRYNFLQAAIYRLRLSDIPGRGPLELYPTLEVVPANMKTSAFLAHSAVPVTFTDEDLEQVVAGNYVVKVIYLPDPAFQDLATTGPSEVVSSRLEPGVDPVAEACRRGSILAVVRLGNIDLNLPHSPSMDQPSPYQPKLPLGPPPGMPDHGPLGMGGPGMPGPMGPMGPGGMGPMGPGMPMMGPGGPMPGNVGMMPPAPSGPPAPSAPASPVGKAPETSPVQQAQYVSPPPMATPASLASQGPDGAGDKKSGGRSWIIP